MGLTDTNGLSAADIAAVTGGNNGFGAFGGDGAWLILILLLFAAFNGNGWGGGNTPYVIGNVDGTIQRGFDQSALMASMGGLNSTVTNGFADAAVAQCNQTMNIMNGFSGVMTLMMQNEMARQQSCNDTKQQIADLKYTIATEACADRAAVTAGVQTVLDKINQQELEALRIQNSNLQTQINMQNLAASQAAQTAQLIADNTAQTQYIVNRVAPYPIPSYTVPNPFGATGTT